MRSPLPPAAALPTMPRVVVTSRHGLVAQAVGEALRGRGVQVRTVPGGAREWSRWEAGPDEVVLLLDELDSRAGLESVLAAVRRAGRPVLVLTNRPRDPVWGAVYAAGAAGVASAGQSVDELERTLHRVARAVPLVEREERKALMAQWSAWLTWERELDKRVARLSPRETTVLALLADGRGIGQITEQLGVGAETVRSQVKSIRRKLRVDSQLAAVALVHQVTERLPPENPFTCQSPA